MGIFSFLNKKLQLNFSTKKEKSLGESVNEEEEKRGVDDDQSITGVKKGKLEILDNDDYSITELIRGDRKDMKENAKNM